MSHRNGWMALASLGLAWLAIVSPALAVIERPLPLKGLVGDSDSVFFGRVASLDPARPSMVVELQGDIKGQTPFRRLAVLLKGEDDSGKQQIVPRLAVGSAVIGFVTKPEDDDNPQTLDPLIALVYFEGTWVQLQGTPAGEAYRWQYTHAEPYLRRTFAGRSSELAEVVRNAMAEKAPWPEVQASVKPGLGPSMGEPGNPVPTETNAPGGEVAIESHADSEPPAAAPEPWWVRWQWILYCGFLLICYFVAVLIRTVRQSWQEDPPPGK